MRLLITGPPGAGKGTQATAVAKRYHIPAVSSGEIFRDNIKRHTPLGDRVVEIIGRGDFVPDVVTTSLVFQRLMEPDCAFGWLLDGYPRTLGQVEALDIAMAERSSHLDAVIVLEAEPEALVERMLSRSRLEGRPDDNAGAIAHRIHVYHAETEPVLAVYQARDLVVRVDADGTVEQVRERLLGALEEKLGG